MKKIRKWFRIRFNLLMANTSYLEADRQWFLGRIRLIKSGDL